MSRDFSLGNGRVLTQTDEQCRKLVKQAIKMAERVAEMSLLEKLVFVRKSIERSPCVIGVFSTDGPARKDGSFNFHIIKGRRVMQAAADDGGRYIPTLAVSCTDLADAQAMERALGDGRQSEVMQ
jgi:hypothetical protein